LSKLKLNIVIVGAGNVAWHLAKELQKKEQKIIQVYNRSVEPAISLSHRLKCDFTTRIEDINQKADLYILTVKDSIIEEVSELINIKNKLIVHTSGAVEQDVIKHKRRGVFYPLQTFSKEKKLNFKNIPFCIEASTSEDYSTLMRLATLLSPKVYNIDSNQRKVLHVAAVFACNFSNYMYMISDEILSDNNIPLDILYPLIKETATKITKHKPKDVQTGPAVREDKSVIEEHLNFLKNGKNYDIYKLLSKNIIDKNKDEL
tara:strand:- start:1597 stop:2376 length:780 start_codon:yes stop_codon:yes gene_type:complete